MGKSEQLRVQDVRDAFRLIGDCRDLGSDPALWFPRMLEGLSKLFGAFAATGGEGRVSRSRVHIEPLSAFQFGLGARDCKLYMEFCRRGGPALDPLFSGLHATQDDLITRIRPEVVSDATWYRSALFNENYRVTGIDHRLASMYRDPSTGAVCAINLDRASGDRDFSARERGLLHFFHEELSRLFGRALTSANDPSPEKLSPRLRQTLACLMEGDSEKQIAARLGLSHATVHQYVTALYRRFGVQSRGQLLAHVVKRNARFL